MASHFKLILILKKQPGDEMVCFKIDGGRFDTDKTLKFNVNTEYSLEFAFQPAQDLQGLTIQGTTTKFDAKEKSKYLAKWMTDGVSANQKGKRVTIPLLLELSHGVLMKIDLQSKFYGEKETSHVKWGTPIAHLEYECSVSEGSTSVNITKEVIR